MCAEAVGCRCAHVLSLAGLAWASALASAGGTCFNDAGQSGPCGPGYEQCWPNPSTNKPQFHITDRTCKENDPTAPFFDELHGLYHYFFAVHPGPRRVKRHVVSRDLVRWAYLPIPFWEGPEPYDRAGIFTGSVTVVDGKPQFVYPALCDVANGSWPDCKTGTSLAIAVPANESDPFYRKWTKKGVIVNNTEREPSVAWLDTDTSEWRLTTFGGVVYGSTDFKTWSISEGKSGFDLGKGRVDSILESAHRSFHVHVPLLRRGGTLIT